MRLLSLTAAAVALTSTTVSAFITPNNPSSIVKKPSSFLKMSEEITQPDVSSFMTGERPVRAKLFLYE